VEDAALGRQRASYTTIEELGFEHFEDVNIASIHGLQLRLNNRFVCFAKDADVEFDAAGAAARSGHFDDGDSMSATAGHVRHRLLECSLHLWFGVEDFFGDA
jgi:hypothetical protein